MRQSLLLGLCAVILFVTPGRSENASSTLSRTTFSVVVGGDLGLNADKQPVLSTGTIKHGSLISWASIVSGLDGAINGDINFANLETVVTDRNDLRATQKSFNFRSHPDGIEHLLRAGFNLLSTANNHAIDYGREGIRETITHLDRLKDRGLLLAHAGVASNRKTAVLPAVFSIKGLRVGFGAIGIDSGGRATDSAPGQLAWRSPDDENAIVHSLEESGVNFRILSVHHGQELNPYPEDYTRNTLRRILSTSQINLILGHHAHVVQGIELINGSPIFYGLGNLLHPGMADNSRFGACADYGILAKLHYRVSAAGKAELAALEVFPLTQMHARAQRLEAKRSAERIRIINDLSAKLKGQATSAVGVQLAVQNDGSGLYCSAVSIWEDDDISTLCRNWRVDETDLRPASGSCPAYAVASRSREVRLKKRSAQRSNDNSWIRGAFEQQ